MVHSQKVLKVRLFSMCAQSFFFYLSPVIDSVVQNSCVKTSSYSFPEISFNVNTNTASSEIASSREREIPMFRTMKKFQK